MWLALGVRKNPTSKKLVQVGRLSHTRQIHVASPGSGPDPGKRTEASTKNQGYALVDLINSAHR
jgi:hypothetical protein